MTAPFKKRPRSRLQVLRAINDGLCQAYGMSLFLSSLVPVGLFAFLAEEVLEMSGQVSLLILEVESGKILNSPHDSDDVTEAHDA